MLADKKDFKAILLGLGFLAPNICGFLAFTLIPLITSLIMAFTDWNLEMHNVFKDTPVSFVGLDNFKKLFTEKDFLKYLGNTLFFMMGIPFGVGGSLLAAILLSSDFKGGNKKIWIKVIASIGLTIGCCLMLICGMGASAMTILICGLAGLIIISGSIGGQTVYRTLFYFPHFTAGVATYILWKKLYSPETGPVNNALNPILKHLTPLFASIPQSLASAIAMLIAVLIIALCVFLIYRNSRNWRDGENGTISLIIGNLVLTLPLIFMMIWAPTEYIKNTVFIPIALAWLYSLWIVIKGREHYAPYDRGLANAVVICGACMVMCLIMLGLSRVIHELPLSAAEGFQPPKWLADYHWAKPALMIMGFWAAVGSNNMLLYMAGLSGVSQELYEASDIDGANALQRFWHVTWPQLAPITFFILVMAMIHGLQGGFEMARTMTGGGPAGATTTLSYYIFSEGFSTGRMGYASAVSWALFALVFSVTLFNWKFGNKYTND
jgi:multiple sugar transport system permease protein